MRPIYGEIKMSSNVDRLVETAKEIWDAAESVVGSMKEKDRKQIKELAEAVSALVGKDSKDVLHLVNMYAHGSETGYVTRGKGGGFIKGTRPVKVVKAAPVVVADVTPAVDPAV
jgi:hypothetical protein